MYNTNEYNKAQVRSLVECKNAVFKIVIHNIQYIIMLSE